MAHKFGQKWREHATPYLKKALQAASKTWKPKQKKVNMNRVKQLRKQREDINGKIKKELGGK